jgi:hypothetical protein
VDFLSETYLWQGYSYLECRHMSPCPACWLRWHLANFLPWLSWKCDPPDLCLLSNWSYRYELLCRAEPRYLLYDLGMMGNFSDGIPFSVSIQELYTQ